MRTLHPDVADTAKEFVIKNGLGFRLRMEKWESISPKGLYAIDLIQETIAEDGTVKDSSSYNFHMTKEELQRLAEGLVE